MPPLEHSSSEAALHHNIATEVEAGKPADQAAAIAYSVQRHSDCDMSQITDGTAGLPTVISQDEIGRVMDENRDRQGIGGTPPYEQPEAIPTR